MIRIKDGAASWIRVCVVSIALSIAFGSLSTSLQHLSAQAQKAPSTMYSSKRMADGKQWTTHNLDVNTDPVLLLRRCGTELPPVWPFVYVGIGAASMSIIGRWMAIADRRRMAADGEALWWSQRGFG